MSAETTIAAFRQQVFLGRGTYLDLTTGVSHALLAAGGRILKAVFQDTNVVLSDLNPSDRNNPAAQTYFVQAENYAVIQNGIDIPFIYDGMSLRRSHTGSNNPDLSLVSITQSGTTVTVETLLAHPFVLGSYIEIAGSGAGAYAGQYYVTAVPTSTSFQFEAVSSLPDSPSVTNVVARFVAEVPVGTIMAYGQGRLFVVDSLFSSFVAGDLVYGDENNSVSNLLNFTETTYLSEGGAFKLPTPAGRITGLRFVSYQDTATGQGDLIAYGEHGAGSFNVSIERSQWKTNGIQKVLFANIGCTSDDSIVDFNGDQFFRSIDGERSYRMARADAFSYGQTPVSAEIGRVLDQDVVEYLNRASGVSFDNRLLFTCAPEQEPYRNPIVSITVEDLVVTVETEFPHSFAPNDTASLVGTDYLDGVHVIDTVPSETTLTFGIGTPVPSQPGPENAYVATTPASVDFSHAGVVALDFMPLSSNANKVPAAYQGTWYGQDAIRSLFTLTNGRDKRAFYIGRNEDGENTIVEIARSFGDDWDGSEDVRIPAWVETRGFAFEKPLNLKRLVRADLWLEELEDDVDFKVYFRPDQHPTWFLWHEFTLSGPPADTGSDPLSKTVVTGTPRYRSQVTLPTPPDTENTADGRLARYGFSFQVRIEWEGNAQLGKFVIYANDLVEGLQQGGQR